MGFGFVIKFIDFLQLVSTINYRTATISHTLQYSQSVVDDTEP
jgi:hypothetical protein